MTKENFSNIVFGIDMTSASLVPGLSIGVESDPSYFTSASQNDDSNSVGAPASMRGNLYVVERLFKPGGSEESWNEWEDHGSAKVADAHSKGFHLHAFWPTTNCRQVTNYDVLPSFLFVSIYLHLYL